MDPELSKSDMTTGGGVEADVKSEEPQPDVAQRSSQRVVQVFERYINLPAVINFELVLQAAWQGSAVTFQFSLVNGGPASMLYGALLAGVGATAVSASLAEMASMDPTVGAQYRWSARFAPFAPRFWALIQGWITVAAWIFSVAAVPAMLANLVTALIIFNNESYVLQRWHTSMLMWLFILLPLFFNLWFRKLINIMETVGGICFVIGFIINIITLTLLAKRSTNDFVWKTLTHESPGWTNPGIAWSIGLLTVTGPLTGSDGILHMSDEVKRVKTRVPISIITATISNAVFQFAFLVCLLYTIGDITVVTNDPTGLPILQVYYQATNSKAWSSVLVAMLGFMLFFALFNILASVSRLTWAFACDRGLPFSDFFSTVHPTFKIPLNALGLISAISFLLSLIYIASSTAYNAIISLYTLGLQVSYIIPILFILLKKVRGPPIKEYGPFKIGRWGIPVNIFALSYVIFVIIWTPFPPILPVTGQNMNYASPVFIAIILGALADWIISARKRFEVPVARHNPMF
jgi:amino acid transporter